MTQNKAIHFNVHLWFTAKYAINHHLWPGLLKEIVTQMWPKSMSSGENNFLNKLSSHQHFYIVPASHRNVTIVTSFPQRTHLITNLNKRFTHKVKSSFNLNPIISDPILTQMCSWSLGFIYFSVRQNWGLITLRSHVRVVSRLTR